MSKRTARYGGAPAPYTKQQKTPYRYDGVPLNKSDVGTAPTRKNLIAFYTRLGNRTALAKLKE